MLRLSVVACTLYKHWGIQFGVLLIFTWTNIMPGRPSETSSLEIPTKLKPVLSILQTALDYADDTNSDPWDFAVSIPRLRELGIDETDLRWLVRKGLVKHAREVTLLGDDGREFRSTGDLTFCKRTCFVLTEAAGANHGSVASDPPQSAYPNRTSVCSTSNGRVVTRPTVSWDADTRRLCVNGQVVKRFKWPAANQEIVLNAFQEEGWPERIDDPLPPQPDQNPKRRLSDTIKCLNRKQTNHLIHFHGDGTGEGIIWAFERPAPGAS